MPGTQGQFCQELSVSQPTNFAPGSSFRLRPHKGGSCTRTCTGHTTARGPLKTFQKMLGLMASASLVLQLGMLRMRPLQYWLKPQIPPHAWRHGRIRVRVSQACVTALAPWKDPQWLKQGVTMGLIHRRKVVSTDPSNTGWGALCEGRPTFGSWSDAEGRLHINCLEMTAVCRALQTFLPDLKGHHVLVRSDSMTVVSYINRQGGLTSKRLPEPLQSADLKTLSLKTALLLALALVKRVGDLQALSVSPACLEFGPNDSKVVLRPRHGYVPKVLYISFRAQVITLSALPGV